MNDGRDGHDGRVVVVVVMGRREEFFFWRGGEGVGK